jgi:membrane protease subunit HflC
MKIGRIISALIVLVVVIIAFGSLFTLQEWEQAVITQLGEVKRTIYEPGLHTKIPMLQTVHKFDKWLLQSDPGESDLIYTLDKKNLQLDNFVIWRIQDPVAYLKSFPGRRWAAERRLDEIVFSQLRKVLGLHTQDEIVIKERESIMDSVTALCNLVTDSLGIDVIDVRIKRADLPQANERAVFARMKAEREREAEGYRSRGQAHAAQVRAYAQLTADSVKATADQLSEQVRGGGDASALEIYAKAYQRDPRFYEFTRSLLAYETALDTQTVLILSPNDRFLKQFRRGMGR